MQSNPMVPDSLAGHSLYLEEIKDFDGSINKHYETNKGEAFPRRDF